MDKFTFFWKATSPFSQWHPTKFQIEGIAYNCCEQFMMHQKALLFEDYEIAKKILESNDPGDQKQMGRKVKNFNQEIWEKECRKIVYQGNYAKFAQNEHLLKKLLDTTGTTMVEASPYDNIWGIGLLDSHPDAKDRNKWRGENRLGEILTQVREDIIKERNRNKN